MLISFIRALKQSSQETGLALSPVIGMDVRPRLQLGKVGFGFAVLGAHIICIKTRISDDDPTWTGLRASGVEEVFHMQSVPAAINKAQLAQTKCRDN